MGYSVSSESIQRTRLRETVEENMKMNEYFVRSLRKSNDAAQNDWDFVLTRLTDMYETIFQKKNTGIDSNTEETFFSLVRAYRYYPISTYKDLFITAFSKLKDNFPDARHIVWLPTTLQNKSDRSSPKDFSCLITESIKSSDVLRYLTTGFTCYSYQMNCFNNALVRDSTKKILQNETNMKRNETLFVLIDDFIGSGKQCCSALDTYTKAGVKIDAVLSLVILESGRDEISHYSASFEGEIIQNNLERKVFFGDIATTATEIVSEDDIDHLYGELALSFDKRSTALVTMVRTPNNTLQMFRTPKKRAPFPRET